MAPTGGKQDRAKRARRRFTDEFKAGAVSLVLEEGKTVAQLARNLDPTATTLPDGAGASPALAPTRLTSSRCPVQAVRRGRCRDSRERPHSPLRRSFGTR
jgi:transposase-like protein